MGWIDLLHKPQSLLGLYDDEPPLESFALSFYSLKGQGGEFRFAGRFARFPDNPRPGMGGNENFAIGLALADLHFFEASGWTPYPIVDVKIESHPDDSNLISIEFGNDEIHVKAIGEFLYLTDFDVF